MNVAGEGPNIAESIWLGDKPSEPLNLTVTDVVPDTSLSLGWTAPLSDGCLTILSYTIAKDDVDYITDLSPTATKYVDDISVGGSVGEVIKYEVKAINHAGESVYSEPIFFTVGFVPNAPKSL